MKVNEPPKIDNAINFNNRELFEKHKFDGTIEYTCLFCKEKKDIFNMVSNSGDRMICTLCAKKYFGSPMIAVNTFCIGRKSSIIKLKQKR